MTAKDNSKKSGVWEYLVSGGVAGAVSRTCTAPLNRVKVFLQVQQKKTGIIEAVGKIVRDGGVKSLWRGNGAHVLKSTPESAVKFAAFEKIKSAISSDDCRSCTFNERILAGTFAGGISQATVYPLEVLRTRMSLSKSGEYRGIAYAAKKIFLKEGFRVFGRGFVPNTLSCTIFVGIDLAVYETLKKQQIMNNDHSKFVASMKCAFVSSTLGQLFSYPFALVGTRLQGKFVIRYSE